MSKYKHHKFLKDDNSLVNDHLHNHVHLTNCIHLKNHMHRQSPVIAGRSLTRDLLVLQRSKSLRDPSTSPPLWRTPTDGSLERKQKNNLSLAGGRSVEIEGQWNDSRVSEISPWLQSMSKTKVVYATNDQNRKSGDMMVETIIKDGSSRNSDNNIPSSGKSKAQASSSIEMEKDRRKPNAKKHSFGLSAPLRTLSEQLEENPDVMEKGNAKHSHNSSRNGHPGHDSSSKDPQTRENGEFNRLTRTKRRNVTVDKRARDSTGSRDTRVYISDASNSLVQDPNDHGYCLGTQEGDEIDAAHRRNACGIPWNWSRIHHRGKTFLDKAGRSFSCGLSDTRIRKDEIPTLHSHRDNSVLPDHSCSFSQSDSDALPLLNDDVFGAQENFENSFVNRNHSGELGIFASTNDQDSDSYSDVRLHNYRYRGRYKGRHECFTQKYMPKTFEDLAGQILVVQALTNAIQTKRVGLIYVFYGPQGTGKSSCARIFAKALNCQSPDIMKPCGVCSSCISFNLGKNRNILDMGPIWNFDMESAVESIGRKHLTSFPLYRVFVIDDCDTLSSDSWSFISKVVDQAPRSVVFLFITASLHHLPHIITSRCQKFFFSKLKDSNIINKLQSIASKEGLEIGEDALKLIASRSDGSLRDAEMTLDQLSLLRRRISLNLVQELVGLVSDEKVVDLLDLALCADTMNTIKCLREIMNAGVEPLALVSQLATVITDILAGSYIFSKERPQRSFFHRPMLSKELQKLRFALKTLSDAEKHLRASNDKITWLTATLLQLAPEQQYMSPNSSDETSSSNSLLRLKYTTERELLNKPKKKDNLHSTGKGLFAASENTNGSKDNESYSNKIPVFGNALHSVETSKTRENNFMDIDRLWMSVIDQIQISALKHFMHQEGRLISLSFGAAPTVQLMFSSTLNKSKAEKFRGYILQAFESVLCTGVTLQFISASPKHATYEVQNTHNVAAFASGSSQVIGMQGSSDTATILKDPENSTRRFSKDTIVRGVCSVPSKQVPFGSHEKSKSEIIEILASPTRIQQTVSSMQLGEQGYENDRMKADKSSHNQSTVGIFSKRNDNGEQPRKRSLMRGRVSLAHVLQQARGRTQRSGWSQQKAVSVAEKLEQENMKLEPKSRSLICWKVSNCARRKLLPARTRTKKPRSFLKLVSCGRCFHAKTAR